jgi:hypothetical protein
MPAAANPGAVAGVHVRRPVFWDGNAGGWVYRLPDRSGLVQAESWAAAWSAVLTWHSQAAAAAAQTPPAPAPLPRRRRWFGLLP